ncbi:hypothetical protein LWI28_002089 [Acer negundo]|uniref:Uncharacterized protein n=1 Tax=Acer negundo TaxID=4023 RepID=A0AAD5IBB8_ACENE|nr:hypothetical protein LWI28_002089 [Acer negundo]
MDNVSGEIVLNWVMFRSLLHSRPSWSLPMLVEDVDGGSFTTSSFFSKTLAFLLKLEKASMVSALSTALNTRAATIAFVNLLRMSLLVLATTALWCRITRQFAWVKYSYDSGCTNLDLVCHHQANQSQTQYP